MAKGRYFNRYDLLDCYMVFSGIPYYLDYIDKDHSLAQNVDRMVFADDAPLQDEFQELYYSLFGNSDLYIRVVNALSLKKKGLLRSKVVEAIGAADGKGVTEVLNNLVLSGFIRRYHSGIVRTNLTMDGLFKPVTLNPDAADHHGTDHHGRVYIWREQKYKIYIM
jgi:hypothetical protein